MSKRMQKSGGTNSVSNRMAFTQNTSDLPVDIHRLGNIESLSMMVPGEGNVSRAVGAVKENSTRKYADALSTIVGGPSVDREASTGDNH